MQNYEKTWKPGFLTRKIISLASTVVLLKQKPGFQVCRLLFLSFVFFFFNVNFVSAEDQLVYTKDRFDIYTIDLRADFAANTKQDTYKNGQDVYIDVRLINRGQYCLLDGALIYDLIGVDTASIARLPNLSGANDNGENVISEEAMPVVICPGQDVSMPIIMKLPDDLRAGDYRIDLYLRSPRAQVNGRHETYATVNYLSFKIVGSGNFPQARIVGSKTTFAGGAYQNGPIVLPNFEQASLVGVENMDAKELFDGKIVTSICVYNKFSGLGCKDVGSQDVSVPPSESKNFRKSIKIDFPPDAYSVVYQLTDKSGRVNSNYNNVFIVSGHEASIRATALDRLSYSKGDKINILVGVSGPYSYGDSSAFVSDISLKMELFDTGGNYENKVFSKERIFSKIGADSQGKYYESFIAGSDITAYRVCGTLSNKQKVLESRCISAGQGRAVISWPVSYALVVAVIIAVLALIVWVMARRRAILLIIFLLGTTGVVYSDLNVARAEMRGLAAPLFNNKNGNGVWGNKCSNITFYFDRNNNNIPELSEKIDLAVGADNGTNRYYIPKNTIAYLYRPLWDKTGVTRPVDYTEIQTTTIEDCSGSGSGGGLPECTATAVADRATVATNNAAATRDTAIATAGTAYDTAITAADATFDTAYNTAVTARDTAYATYETAINTAWSKLRDTVASLLNDTAKQNLDAAVSARNINTVAGLAYEALKIQNAEKSFPAYRAYETAMVAANYDVLKKLAADIRDTAFSSIEAIYKSQDKASDDAFYPSWCIKHEYTDNSPPYYDCSRVPKLASGTDKTRVYQSSWSALRAIYRKSDTWQIALEQCYYGGSCKNDAYLTTVQAWYDTYTHIGINSDTSRKLAWDRYDLATSPATLASAVARITADATAVRDVTISSANAAYNNAVRNIEALIKAIATATAPSDVADAAYDTALANATDAKQKAYDAALATRDVASASASANYTKAASAAGEDAKCPKSTTSTGASTCVTTISHKPITISKGHAISLANNILLGGKSEYADCLQDVPLIECPNGAVLPITSADDGQWPVPVMDVVKADPGAISIFTSVSKYVVALTAEKMIDAINNNTYSSNPMDTVGGTNRTAITPPLSAVDVPSVDSLNSSGDLTYIDSFVGLDRTRAGASHPRLSAQIFRNYANRIAPADNNASQLLSSLDSLMASVYQSVAQISDDLGVTLYEFIRSFFEGLKVVFSTPAYAEAPMIITNSSARFNPPAPEGRAGLSENKGISSFNPNVASVFDIIKTLFDVSTVNAASPSCVVAPSNLVSWWPGEDNANDAKGTNNGTPNGGVTYPTGQVIKTFNFNGTSQYINMSNSTSLQLATVPGTVEAWVKVNSTTGDLSGGVRGIMVKQGVYGLFLNNGVLSAYSWGGTQGFRSTGVNLANATNGNNWHHIAMTFQSGASTAIYIDGQAIALTPSTFITYSDNSKSLTIGSGGFSGTTPVQFFNGSIDEPSVYNRILSASEIQAIYNAGVSGKCKAPGAPTAVAGSNQVSITGWASVPGIDSYRLYSSTDNFVTSTQAGGDILTANIPTIDNQLVITSGMINGNSYTFKVAAIVAGSEVTRSLASAVVTLQLPPSAPTLLVALAGNNRVLLNWTAPGGTVTGYKIYRSTSSNTEVLLATPSGTFTTYVDLTAFNGTRYYYKVMATNSGMDSSLSTEASATPAIPVCAGSPNMDNLVSWWPGEDNNDFKGVNNGTKFGIVTYPVGKVGNTFSLDGTTGYISAGNNTSLQLATVPGTVEAWVKVNSATGDLSGSFRGIMVKQGVYGLFLNNGVLGAYSWGGTQGFRSTGVNLANATNGNNWHHIAMTFQSGASTAIYIDGQATVLTPSTAITYTTDQSKPLGIGAGAILPSAGQFFNGSIDEPSVYNRILTKSEIQAIYLADIAGKCRAPFPPTFPASPIAISNGVVTITWNSSVGAEGYNLYRGTSTGFATSPSNRVNTSDITDTSYVDNSASLTIGTPYFYKVTAIDTSQTIATESMNSAEVIAVLPYPPADPVFAPTAIVNGTQVTLNWPTVAEATGYRVYRNTSNSTTTTDVGWAEVTDQCGSFPTSGTASCTITGLTNNTDYYFFIKASNNGGLSGFSPGSGKVTPQLKPNAPTDLRGVGGDARVSLVWSAPPADSAHGMPMGYYVYYSSNNFTDTVKSALITNSFATITSLSNGTSYKFKVSATNAASGGGESDLSPSSAAITPVVAVFTVPLGCSAGTISNDISIVGSMDSGDCSATYNGNTGKADYYSFAGVAGQLVTVAMADSVSLDDTFLDLLKVNGDGTLSILSADVNGALSYNDQNSSCNVSLASLLVPSANNARICDYQLPANGNYVIAASSKSSSVTGEYILALGVTTPSLAAPAKPTAMPSDARVTLSWPAVKYATGYYVYSNTANSTTGVANVTSVCANDISVVGSVVSCTITGLVNDLSTGYYFFIKASNAGGNGLSDFSLASDKVMPQAKPGVPTGVIGVVGDRRISLAWSAPSIGSVSGYFIYSSVDNYFAPINSIPAPTTSYIAKNLTNGSLYAFRVSATNVGGGEGVKSGPSAIYTPSLLLAPTDLTSTLSPNSATLAWVAPFIDSTYEPIIGYTIKYWPTANINSPVSRDVLLSPVTITGLNNDTLYSFEVAARTSGGTGTYSSVVGGIPTVPLGAIKIGDRQSDGTYQLTNTAQTHLSVSGRDYWIDLDGVRTWLWTHGLITRQTTNTYNHPTGSRAVTPSGGVLQYKIKESGFYNIFTRDTGSGGTFGDREIK